MNEEPIVHAAYTLDPDGDELVQVLGIDHHQITAHGVTTRHELGRVRRHRRRVHRRPAARPRRAADRGSAALLIAAADEMDLIADLEQAA